MRQEMLFCHQVLHYLHDFITDLSTCRFCLDGEAAKSGVREGKFKDPWVPDLVVPLIGAFRPLTIEAKVIESGKIRFCGDGQPAAWCERGSGALHPALWIGADEESQSFYLWEHEGFNKTLCALVGTGKTAKGRKKTLEARVPNTAERFSSITALVDAIIKHARHHGYYRPR